MLLRHGEKLHSGRRLDAMKLFSLSALVRGPYFDAEKAANCLPILVQ